MSDHMLTPEDMEQLRPAWAELCRHMRAAAEGSRAREVVRTVLDGEVLARWDPRRVPFVDDENPHGVALGT